MLLQWEDWTEHFSTAANTFPGLGNFRALYRWLRVEKNRIKLDAVS